MEQIVCGKLSRTSTTYILSLIDDEISRLQQVRALIAATGKSQHATAATLKAKKEEAEPEP
jgi:hypothetical protein